MKADSNGTKTEQFRASIAWKTAAQLRRNGQVLGPEQTCISCDFSEIRLFTKGDESIGSSLRCAHPLTPAPAGMATRESARCDKYQRKVP
jgi:hypothetical protein